jgi:hypothetical protein
LLAEALNRLATAQARLAFPPIDLPGVLKIAERSIGLAVVSQA